MATGYLPNRARLIVASFLVKHLLVDWRHGEAWFWDTLIDADPANNPLNWQWVAGAGVNSAPYFRIFNPVLQAEKFDPTALTSRSISSIPSRCSRARGQSTALGTLRDAPGGVVLGKTYREPIVDHRRAPRPRA